MTRDTDTPGDRRWRERDRRPTVTQAEAVWIAEQAHLVLTQLEHERSRVAAEYERVKRNAELDRRRSW